MDVRGLLPAGRRRSRSTLTSDVFESFSTATWTAIIRERSAEVRLRGKALTFELSLLACDEPKCPCEVVRLHFREVAGPGRAALAFDVQVDLQTEAGAVWQALGAEADALGRQVAEGCRGAARDSLRDALRQHRARILDIPNTIARFATRGEMVPFAHVLAGGDETEDTYAGWLSELESEGVQWRVMDSICCAPRCDCAEVKLFFFGWDGERELRFDVSVPLTASLPRPADLVGVSEARAMRVFTEWEGLCDKAALRTRYDRARALGKAGLEPAAAPVRPRAPARIARGPEPGRREACPCGSGKRYKNCCGREGR